MFDEKDYIKKKTNLLKDNPFNLTRSEYPITGHNTKTLISSIS